MRFYPQLASGLYSPLPVVRRRHFRTVLNRLAGNQLIGSADQLAAYIEWELQYKVSWRNSYSWIHLRIC